MTAPTTTHFLTDIEIKEFKCFKDFKASGFKRVNLIGGKNNVGKTAFMEACFINVRSGNINKMTSAIWAIKAMRENLNFLDDLISGKQVNHIEIINLTRSYFVKTNLADTAFLIKDLDAIKEYFYSINSVEKYINSNDFSFIPDYDKNIKFIDNFGLSDNELISIYKVIQKLDKENELNNYIKEFDDSIENFKVIGDKPQCKTNGEYRDITEFGDGLKHYISIICALYACENGYLFIDEIDNGIYYDQLDRLWEIILTLSQQTKCQVFATTHSKEMLESFARVAEKLSKEDIAHQDISYTLLVKNKKQEIKTISLGFKDILESYAQEIEVR